jgi:hypothetical protein
MTAAQQQAMDRLYALDNLLTIRITMPRSEWEAVQTQEPAGGRCNFDWTGRARFSWRKAASVEVAGTAFPPRTTFPDVGVKKKSFCGSFSNEKPCLHLDFGKFVDDTDAVEALIGTRYLTLNNSWQDDSYIRQPLAYRLLAMAGLPHSRCNYARVFVNDVAVGQGFANVSGPGVYVNAESVMKRYIERNFGNTRGNLYELEHKDDFIRDRFEHVAVESLSRFDNRADLKIANDHIAAHGLAGAAQVFDLDHFIKIYAMEFFLKHWDGYAENRNNTYAYNDVVAVEHPSLDDVKFKLIPWGVDQTFRPDRPFKLSHQGHIAGLVRRDPTQRQRLLDQVGAYRDSVFGRDKQQTVWKPLLDQLEGLVTGLGVPHAAAEIATVRHQLRLAESAGYLCAGVPTTTAVYLLKHDTHACLHASNTETIPRDTPTATEFEVYHQPWRDDDDATDLWCFAESGTGRSLVNQAYDRVLHASDSVVSSEGHKLLYTCPTGNTDRAEEFVIEPLDSPDAFTYSGFFALASVRTGLRAKYGLDTTPLGRARVHQERAGSKLYLY